MCLCVYMASQLKQDDSRLPLKMFSSQVTTRAKTLIIYWLIVGRDMRIFSPCVVFQKQKMGRNSIRLSHFFFPFYNMHCFWDFPSHSLYFKFQHIQKKIKMWSHNNKYTILYRQAEPQWFHVPLYEFVDHAQYILLLLENMKK